MQEGGDQDDISNGIHQQSLIFCPLEKVSCHIKSCHRDSSYAIVEIDTSQKKTWFAFKVASAFRAFLMHDEPIPKHASIATEAAL